MNQSRGFTLIEVMLALLIIAIALTALVKSTGQSVNGTAHIKDKTISHLIAMQGVSLIQLGLLSVSTHQETTQTTTMLGQRWYWRVNTQPTAIENVQKIIITVSKRATGPFGDPLQAYRYSV